MKAYRTADTTVITHLMLFLATCVFILPIGTAYGEEDAANPPTARRIRTAVTTQPAGLSAISEERIVKVYKLKFAEAAVIASIVNQTFGNTSLCTPDARTNAVIISVRENLEKKVDDLIASLDMDTGTPSGEPVISRIYALKHTSAKELSTTINTILGGRNSYCVSSGNNIVINAPEDLQQKAEAILQRLDQPIHERDLVTTILPLINVQVNDIKDSFGFLIEGKGISYTLDTKQNAFIVRTAPDDVPFVKETVAMLDRPNPEESSKEDKTHRSMKVRVVWLISEYDPTQADPPADLKNVISELNNVGISGLKLAAQNIVQVLANENKFQIRSSPPLGEQCYLDIEGTLSSIEPAKTQLQISLKGELELVRGAQKPFQIETTIQAPTGHSTVLGVLPIQDVTSVFIVQVMPGG